MSTENNPYLSARRQWDERYGSLVSARRNWQITAAASMALSLVIAVGMVITLARSRFTTYIVAVDAIGRPVAAGPAEHKPVIDDRLKRAALQDWLIAWRSVSTDTMAAGRSIRDIVYAHVDVHSAAVKQIETYYVPEQGGQNPFERAKKETVEVQVESILPTSEHSYDLRWNEITYDLGGEVQSRKPWTAAVSVVVSPPRDEAQARANPLGIYVTNVSWSPVITGASK